ncbi:MAG: sugar kinase [Bacillota bacterium]
MKLPDLVTIGETMVVFDGSKPGPLSYIESYERHTGGAETTVAVGVVRLGHTAGWISRLGNDEFGKYVLKTFRGEGLDVSQVQLDNYNPTGIFFRQRQANGEIKNFYYRKGSAASCMGPQDIKEEYIKQAKYLHVTGITPALSESCRKAVEYAMKVAKNNGVKVSFDPNLRLKLWTKEDAQKTLLELMRLADIVLPGIEECRVLFGTDKVDTLFERITAMGPDTVVIKTGSDGAVGLQKDERVEVPGFRVKIVDPFGAGDAFAAGFLAGQLKGWNLKKSMVLANALGAMAVTVNGNVEALPTLEEAQMFISGQDGINR